MTQDNTINILGVRINNVGWSVIDSFCRAALIQAAPKVITTINGEIILIASKNPEYKRVLNKANLAIPDSTNIVWVSRIKGYKFGEPTPGSELLGRICKIAQETKKSVFFLGGMDDVAKLTADKIIDEYPDLEIAGISNADPTDPKLVNYIRRKNPDIVFVAYGAPRQELWIDKNKEKITAKLMIGVGGTFDMISGKLPRAPQWMRKMHLEWLWRLSLQPKRIFRIFKALVVFPIKALLS